MQALTKEEIQKLPRCDVELAGIDWQPDMLLVFTLLLPDGMRARLRGTFARHLNIQLEFDERSGGYPMTWDIIYSKLPDNGWHILMDFAGKGAIEFDCSELHFEYVTNAG